MIPLYRALARHVPGWSPDVPAVLEDSFTTLTLRAVRGTLAVDGHPTVIRSAAALAALLTPLPGLNAAMLTSGTVLSPLGLLHFSVSLIQPRFDTTIPTRLELMTPDGRHPAWPTGDFTWLHAVTYSHRYSGGSSPFSAHRAGDPGNTPTPGLHHAMRAVSDAMWPALATPQTIHRLHAARLSGTAEAAEERHALALAAVAHWQAAVTALECA